jgi:hypothetical protein
LTVLEVWHNNPLLRSLISHSWSWLDLLCDWDVALSNLMGDFIFGLDQITAQAAACLHSIDWKVSFDVVLFSDFTLLNKLEKPWETYAAREPETQASGVER